MPWTWWGSSCSLSVKCLKSSTTFSKYAHSWLSWRRLAINYFGIIVEESNKMHTVVCFSSKQLTEPWVNTWFKNPMQRIHGMVVAASIINENKAGSLAKSSPIDEKDKFTAVWVRCFNPGILMTLKYGEAFHINEPLRGEYICHQWIFFIRRHSCGVLVFLSE